MYHYIRQAMRPTESIVSIFHSFEVQLTEHIYICFKCTSYKLNYLT